MTVSVVGDTTQESNETFSLVLSAPTQATLANASAVATIQNDDGPAQPTLTVADVSVLEGNTGTKTMTFTVGLSPAATSTVTVDFATADGTAIAGGSNTGSGGDYVAAAGTLVFAPGDTSKTVLINVVGDLFNESDETFKLKLSNAPNATIGRAQATGTITNDDAIPSVSISPASIAEGQAGASVLAFNVTLSAPSGQVVSVGYATADEVGANAAVTGGDATRGRGLCRGLRDRAVPRRVDDPSGDRARQRRRAERGR